MEVMKMDRVHATTLRVDKNGQLGTINEKDDMFFNGFGTFFIYGYRSYNSAMANLLHLFAATLQKRVDKLLFIRDGSSFINGGQYSSGGMVHETIIYVPYAAHAYRDDPAIVKRKQALFTFYPDTREETSTWGTYPTTINDKERLVRGVQMQEQDKHYFDRVLSRVDTWPVSVSDLQEGRMHSDLFPELKDRGELHVLSLRLDDMLAYVEIAAQMIKHHYFEGRSFDEKQALEQMKVLTLLAAQKVDIQTEVTK